MTSRPLIEQSSSAPDLGMAVFIAAREHHGQVDKAGEPYILHPIRVMLQLHDQGASIVEQCAGVLHDVLEDTAFSPVALTCTFGDEVAALVDVLTRRKDETYLEYMVRVGQSPNATTVKLADLDDNLSRARRGSLSESMDCRYVEARSWLWNLG